MSEARLSASEYSAWRAKLAVVFALRVACAGGVIWLWDDLDSLQKVVAIAVVAVVVEVWMTAMRPVPWPSV